MHPWAGHCPRDEGRYMDSPTRQTVLFALNLLVSRMLASRRASRFPGPMMVHLPEV